MAKAKKAAKKTARKKAPKKGVVGDTSGPETTTLLMPPKSTLENLTKLRGDTRTAVQNKNGTYGKAVSQAAADKHLDRKAFSIAAGLRDMDDERLHITYFHLIKYLDDLGVVKRATAQGEMFESRGIEDEGEEAEGKAGDQGEDAEDDEDGNVVSLGTAARKVTETAGGGVH